MIDARRRRHAWTSPLIAALLLTGGGAGSPASAGIDASRTSVEPGAALNPVTPPARDDSLYAALGGRAVIEAVVDDFLYRIAGDEHLVGFFAHTDIEHFAAAFATQLCDISDGPCDYAGPSMARAHQRMGLTEAHFNAVVEHLRGALIDRGVATGPRNRLLRRLARLHDAVMLYQP